MDENVSKRLHVSGLTPAISADDLSRRLGSFGTVTSLDGFGKRDALHQPRKFAYATLETTKAKLAKCMMLSGSTWKGAKLRIGEAKPDYRERIALENAPQDDSPRPRKRARLSRGVQGVHAQDMSLITPANLHLHPQWHVTPLGRLIRPMRMRPSRPLDPPLDQAKEVSKGKRKTGKERKRKKEPPIRARRRAIDPMRWGSTQMKGVFLEGEVVGVPVDVAEAPRAMDGDGDKDEDEDEDEDGPEQGSSDQEDEQTNVTTPISKETAPPSPQAQSKTQPAPSKASLLPARVSYTNDTLNDDNDLTAERSRTLDFLKDLFGDADSERDWGAAEELSDIDMGQVQRQPSGQDIVDAGEDDFEVVSRSTPVAKVRVLPVADDNEEGEEEEDVPGELAVEKPGSPAPALVQPAKLKDLFAPREEEGFSLFGHLDLDLDLELDEPIPLPQPSIAHRAPATTVTTLPSPTSTTSHLPPFFPTSTTAGRNRNIIEALRDIGGDLVREPDEAKRRARWETAKSELTGEWKRRHREAVKMRRRRGGAGDGA